MIRLGYLLFPSLVRCGETTFKSWSDGRSGTTSLYQLDWSRADSARQAFWIESNFYMFEYPGSLPKKYDDWVKNMQFAIPQNYLDEIHRNARLGLIEWSTERHFDTMIREICLTPAIAYIYTAFRLLADCLYDELTNYFYRGPNKIIAPQALLYKFWSDHTGRGIVRDHAYFHRLEDHIKYSCDDAPQIQEFLKAINDHEVEIEKRIKPITKSDSTSTIIFKPDNCTMTVGSNTTIESPVIISGEKEGKNVG